MNVAIIGSRHITTLDLATYIPENCTLIVSGGAMGVDTLAERYAVKHGIQTMIICPDYERYGRSAPIRRNAIIVDNADMVLAFWDGQSRGTKYTIDYAKAHNKPVNVIMIK